MFIRLNDAGKLNGADFFFAQKGIKTKTSSTRNWQAKIDGVEKLRKFNIAIELQGIQG